ncbi:MAG: hemolysin-type protein, partial [Burkholderiaceae bacterium]
MTNQSITTLKYANLQMAAEALFVPNGQKPETTFSGNIEESTLTIGNKHASVFTTTQATQFAKDWEVVEHISNTKTGFSGTLFRCKTNDASRDLKEGELVMSFRSTEFIDDAVRDNEATNVAEVKAMGFAFGQIADMQNWFEKLNADPKTLGGKPFMLTGYSLGGNLATAFNAINGGGTQILGTYTFNGAGVGLVKKGQNLGDIIDTFDQERKDSAGSGSKFFKDIQVQTIYEDLRGKIRDGARVTSAHYAPIVALPYVVVNAEAQMLIKALDRIKTIQEEFDRIKNTITGPQEVSLSNVEAMNLGYQVAALRAGEKTEALSVASGAVLTATNGRNTQGYYFGFRDVYGDTYPSAVANSQYHYGNPTPVFIEDQPLWRGKIIGAAAKASFDAFGVKLLVNDYANNDFGDTHSLVLMVDSLSVQAVLAKLDPDLKPATLNELLKDASNKMRKTVNGDKGQAEGDVLENVVNSLGKLLISG